MELVKLCTENCVRYNRNMAMLVYTEIMLRCSVAFSVQKINSNIYKNYETTTIEPKYCIFIVCHTG